MWLVLHIALGSLWLSKLCSFLWAGGALYIIPCVLIYDFSWHCVWRCIHYMCYIAKSNTKWSVQFFLFSTSSLSPYQASRLHATLTTWVKHFWRRDREHLASSCGDSLPIHTSLSALISKFSWQPALRYIRESVDSLCRDGADTPFKP